jgi:hypothetical protein
MRLKASIQAGRVMPSVILRKLGAAGAGNLLESSRRHFSLADRPMAGPRFDGERMFESEAENFEMRLVYP